MWTKGSTADISLLTYFTLLWLTAHWELKQEQPTHFQGGLAGGTIQTFYIYAWTLFWVFVSCAGGVSLCRYMLLDQEVAILSINLKGSTLSTVIIYFLIEGILCSTHYIKRHIVVNVLICHSSLNCNDICQLTLQVFSIAWLFMSMWNINVWSKNCRACMPHCSKRLSSNLWWLTTQEGCKSTSYFGDSFEIRYMWYVVANVSMLVRCRMCGSFFDGCSCDNTCLSCC